MAMVDLDITAVDRACFFKIEAFLRVQGKMDAVVVVGYSWVGRSLYGPFLCVIISAVPQLDIGAVSCKTVHRIDAFTLIHSGADAF